MRKAVINQIAVAALAAAMCVLPAGAWGQGASAAKEDRYVTTKGEHPVVLGDFLTSLDQLRANVNDLVAKIQNDPCISEAKYQDYMLSLNNAAKAEQALYDDFQVMMSASNGKGTPYLDANSPQAAGYGRALTNIQYKIIDAKRDLKQRSCMTNEGSMAPPRSSPNAAPVTGIAASLPVQPLDGPLMAAVASTNYFHTFPNVGLGTDTWNLGGALVFGSSSYGLGGVEAPRTQPWYEGNLDIAGSWGQAYTNGWTTSTGLVGGSYDMIAGPVRFGPTVGYASTSTDGYVSQTLNYGGYAQWFASPQVDVFVKGGGFEAHPDSYSGWYAGGSVTGYLCPKFALNAGVDYTGYNRLDGYHDTSFSLGAEYLFSQTRPISIYAGYAYDTAGYANSYSSYQSHASEVVVGLRAYFNGAGVMTLEDRQRNGEPPAHQMGW